MEYELVQILWPDDLQEDRDLTYPHSQVGDIFGRASIAQRTRKRKLLEQNRSFKTHLGIFRRILVSRRDYIGR
jgi:hypothetical protein